MKVVTIIEPETLEIVRRDHPVAYQIDLELRTLIRQMSMENLLWGAPRESL